MVRFSRLLNSVINKCMVLAVFLLVVVMLMVVANIVARLAGKSIPPTYELSELFTAVTIGFAMVYTTLKKGHVAVEFVRDRFPERMRAVLIAISSLLSLGVLGVIAWANILFTWRNWAGGVTEETVVLEVPYLPIRLLWVFALVLIGLILLSDLFREIGKWTRKS